MQSVNIEDYPQLKSIAWSLKDGTVLEPEEALSLYEANWRFVKSDSMTEKEKELIDRLVREVGNGVFLHV